MAHRRKQTGTLSKWALRAIQLALRDLLLWVSEQDCGVPARAMLMGSSCIRGCWCSGGMSIPGIGDRPSPSGGRRWAPCAPHLAPCMATSSTVRQCVSSQGGTLVAEVLGAQQHRGSLGKSPCLTQPAHYGQLTCISAPSLGDSMLRTALNMSGPSKEGAWRLSRGEGGAPARTLNSSSLLFLPL